MEQNPNRRGVPCVDRRTYLVAAAGAAASLGLSGRTRAASDGPPVDVIAAAADHEWTTVPLSAAVESPVAVAPSLSSRGPQPATTRVRNVGGGAFDLAVEEWRYLDGWHREETVGCLVSEAGSYDLPDGGALEVGRVRTDQRWSPASLSASFSARPVVFSQAQTVNGWQPVVTRHRDMSATGLALRLQEAEAGGGHVVEDVGYLAVDPGAGTLAGRAFEAGVAPAVGDAWQTVEFDGAYRSPVFLADLQTFEGNNTAGVRYRGLTESSVEVRVEEEQSVDGETAHVEERVGYLVAEGTADDTPLGALDRGRVERLVHAYVNERRADHGVAELAFDTDLREIARYHSEDMAQTDYFGHTSPDGETTADRYDMFGYDCRAATGDGTYYTSGENVAYTYYDRWVSAEGDTVRYTDADELARGLVRGWMNSEGHRENILRVAWDDEGVGVYVTSGGTVFATQNFC